MIHIELHRWRDNVCIYGADVPQVPGIGECFSYWSEDHRKRYKYKVLEVLWLYKSGDPTIAHLKVTSV